MRKLVVYLFATFMACSPDAVSERKVSRQKAETPDAGVPVKLKPAYDDEEVLHFLTEGSPWYLVDPRIEDVIRVKADTLTGIYTMNDMIVRWASSGMINVIAPELASDSLEIGSCYSFIRRDQSHLTLVSWDQCARVIDSAEYSNDVDRH